MQKTIKISTFLFLLLLSIASIGSLMVCAATDSVPVQYYVSYTGEGNRDGSNPTDAAFFRDTQLWDKVRNSLATGPVTVNFLPGEYILSRNPKDGVTRSTFRLENIGHPEHQLIIQGLHKEGTIFRTDPTDPIDEALAFDMFYFRGTNALIRYFHFTGEQFINYVTKLYGSHVTLSDCTFIDMPHVIYGASGTHNPDSDHITVKDSTFIRIGFDSHAHMMYNAYGAQHVYVVDNYFEDCSGDYVRFRDRTDYAVVFGNTFKSTGTYRNTNRTFITVPLFNNDDPENPGPNARWEVFGTHMLIANNTFIYPDNNSGGSRQTFYFLNQGYDIPGRQYLLTLEQARLLMRGTVAEKQAFLKENLGIDGDTVFYYGNKIQGRNFTNSMGYYAFPSYGAVSRGWSSPIDITAAVVTTSVAETTAEALAFWDNFIESKRYFAAPRGSKPIDQPQFAVQLKELDFTVQHVHLLVDGETIYAGNHIPTDLKLQTAAYAPGTHEIAVELIDDAGQTYTDVTEFTVEFYHLANSENGWAAQVKGAMPLYFDSIILPEEYQQVTVQLAAVTEGEREEARVLYTGTSLPQDFRIDTMQFVDGAYDVDVVTTTTGGAVDHRMERIVIGNWRRLEDAIESPVTHGWFGFNERLLAVDRSEGWEYSAETPEAFFGDAERIKPQASASGVEYLTWEFANLHHFVFTVYAQPGQATGIVIYVSTDGKAWTEVPYVVNSQEQSGGTWSKLLLAGVVPAQIDASLIRFSVETAANSDQAIELGHVLLYSLVN